MPRSGALLCLASAAAFGAMGIFGKLAYDEGASVATLLSIRFVLAAVLFWALAVATGAIRDLRALPWRDLGVALALGAVGYSAQAGCYFAALRRLDASLLSLVLYTFPAIVAVAAIVLGRERASRRAAAALRWPRWVWCSSWPGPAPARWTPWAWASGSRPLSSTPPTS